MRFDPSVAKDATELIVMWSKIKSTEIRTLAQVLEEYLPPAKCIDFMSVDVEGFDLPLRHSNVWNQFRPEFVSSRVRALKTYPRPQSPRFCGPSAMYHLPGRHIPESIGRDNSKFQKMPNCH